METDIKLKLIKGGYYRHNKIIAPYMENPNAPDCKGETPFQYAERLGFHHGIIPLFNECVKILKTYQ